MTAAAASTGRAQQGLKVLDEALRLLDLLQAQAPPPPPGDHAIRADHVHDHAEPAECRVCPVCRALAALRATNPDAFARMGRAVSDLVGALTDLVGPSAGEAPEPGDTPEPPRPERLRVRRIDVSDE